MDYTPKDYWKERCLRAERYIRSSPCDPDITEMQGRYYARWEKITYMDFEKDNEIPYYQDFRRKVGIPKGRWFIDNVLDNSIVLFRDGFGIIGGEYRGVKGMYGSGMIQVSKSDII